MIKNAQPKKGDKFKVTVTGIIVNEIFYCRHISIKSLLNIKKLKHHKVNIEWI